MHQSERFTAITQLSPAEKLRLSTNWQYPNENNLFIHVNGLKNIDTPTYFLTDVRRDNTDPNQVFSFWPDEQYITHTFAHKYVVDTLKTFTHSSQTILDVGTGCGVSAVLARKIVSQLEISGVNIVGVDINPKAIDLSQRNECLNFGEQYIGWCEGSYHRGIAPEKSASIVYLEPPYNPRPGFLAKHTPKFSDGWDELAMLNFRSQFETAVYHLAPNGSIILNLMTLEPNFLDKYSALGLSIRYIHVYEPITSGDFLHTTFGGDFMSDLRNTAPEKVSKVTEFINRVTTRQSRKFHYIVAIITNDLKGEVIQEDHNLATQSWMERTESHANINRDALRNMI
jgi:hypothetical protein